MKTFNYILLAGALSVSMTAQSEKITHKSSHVHDTGALVNEAAPTWSSLKKTAQIKVSGGNSKLPKFLTSETKKVGKTTKQINLPEKLSRINLRGELISTNSWSQWMGLYSISPNISIPSEMLTPMNYSFTYGLVDNLNGILTGVGYSTYRNQVYICKYNTATWEMEYSENSDNNISALSVVSALDPTDGKIYGVFFKDDSSGYTWGTADWDNFRSEPICEVGDDHLFMSLSADSSGQFYAINWSGDKLYQINKTTGAITSEVTISPSIPTITYMQGGCINDKDNTYLQTYYTEEGSGLIQIDINTGESSTVLEFPNHEEFIGLYIAPSVAMDKAPDSPTFNVSCINGSMNADFTLTAPTTLYDWTSAEGEIFQYTISANGKDLITGEIEAGSTITKSIQMQESGNTEFIATLSNEVGKSPEAVANCYIGKGTPASPSGVTLSLDNDIATLTWQPIFYSSDGGYIDVNFITYTVLDSEGNILADSLKERTFSQKITTPENATFLKYYVKANYAGKSSEATPSNAIFLGEFIPPFTVDLTEEEAAKMHSSIIDANNDGTYWMQHYLRGMCMIPSDRGHDDWLFTPGIQLEADRTYKFTVKANAHVSSLPERIEVKAGSTSDVKGMTISIVEPTLVTEDSSPLEGYITAPTDGKYYIGFHAMSDPNSSYLYLEEYSISTPLDNSNPAEVENVIITPDVDGELDINLSFVMPTRTIEGKKLNGTAKVKIKRNDLEIAEYILPAGTPVQLTDKVEATGIYQYRFETIGEEGNITKDYSQSVFVGPRTPANPENVKLSEQAKDSYLLSWDAVKVDNDGTPINQENITYTVCTVIFNDEGQMQIGEEIEGIKSTSYIYKTPQHISDQSYLVLGVSAVNKDQKSRQFTLGYCWTGDPYKMPVTYTGPSNQYAFTFGSDPEGADVVLLTTENSGIKSQDHDGYMIAIQSSKYDQQSTFSTGTITVSGNNPVLSFYAYPLHGQSESEIQDSNQTIVSVLCEGKEKQVLSYSNEDLPANKWTRKTIDLSKFAGKNIRIGIGTICKGYALSVYDNIKIDNALESDLEIDINGPKEINTNRDFNIDVDVCNIGVTGAKGYTINLYKDNQLVATEEVTSPLESNDKRTFSFTQKLSILDNKEVNYSAKVIYEEDEDNANNTTETMIVTRNLSDLPGVTGLTENPTSEGIVISWNPIAQNEIKDKFLGYNIYRDNKKVNETPTTETSYLHSATTGKFTYQITAVFESGESELSDALIIDTTSLDIISSTKEDITINGKEISIQCAPEAKVSVYSTDGRLIFSNIGESKLKVNSGIYVITIGNKSHKVIVK